MKKTFYILSVLLLAAVGCTKEQSRTDAPDASAFPEGKTVTVDFSIPAPVETRATGMANEPQIENLKVAVFNAAGLLVEYKEASYVEAYATQDETWYKYKVELLLSSTERRIHFIANAPESIDNGSEVATIRNLVTENGVGAYWQRVVVEDGITPYAYTGNQTTFEVEGEEPHTYGPGSYTDAKGNVVNEGDYVQENGDKVVDGTGYFASDKTKEELSKIPLIRNFARIALVDYPEGTTDVHFHPVQFCLVNVPTKGTIAPYDSKAGTFATSYTSAYTDGTLTAGFEFEDIFETGYQANMPADAEFVTLTEDDLAESNWANIMTQVSVDPGTASESAFEDYSYQYMYERQLPSAEYAATCVLVQGLLDDTTEHEEAGLRWFKIEITDLDGKYVPIYRDVTYVMKIKNITIVGTPGWATPYEAYVNKSVGDVSTSTETATLTQIADGKGTTLWVDYIDYTSVEPNATTAPIRYKLFYDTDNVNLTDQVELTVKHSDVPAITTSTITGQPYSGTDTADGQDGWYIAQVPLAAKGDIMKKSTLHIEGPTGASNGAKVLFRDVDYRVIPTQSLNLAIDPAQVAPGIGKQVKLSITLPKDLGFSVFPLVLKVEPLQGNLNPLPSLNKMPNGESFSLPVEYGPSLFDGKRDNTFYFLFTVNFSNYDQANGSVYDLYFTTINADVKKTDIAVQDRKPYFYRANITFQTTDYNGS